MLDGFSASPYRIHMNTQMQMAEHEMTEHEGKFVLCFIFYISFIVFESFVCIAEDIEGASGTSLVARQIRGLRGGEAFGGGQRHGGFASQGAGWKTATVSGCFRFGLKRGGQNYGKIVTN